MCGIFGFVSQKERNSSIILEGLKTLEYRGYDSWGVAIKNQSLLNKDKKSAPNQSGSKLLVEKHVGKIENATLNSQLSNHDSKLGIGHTRWATHGGVTKTNSHPHLDCSKNLALVHNGIVENYEEIRSILVKRGHKFISQTDTEVIIHLIEEEAKTNGFAIAARKAFNKLHGLNAIVILNSVSKEIIAAKNGSPLIVGLSKNTLFISSDIQAFPPEVLKIVILKDNQMAILGEKIKIINLHSGQEKKYITEPLEKRQLETKKGKYPHFLLKEIYDQPEILKKLYLLEAHSIQRLAKNIKSAFGTFTLGCGTASYAAMYGEYLLSGVAKRHINFSVGSEFKYLQDFITKKSLIIPVSQSGETIDVVESVKNAKEKGATIISLVNVPTSTLARMSDYSLFLHAGVEKAVVGTKSFTSMVGLLLLVTYAVVGKTDRAASLLSDASYDITNILSKVNILRIKKLAKKLKAYDHAFTIGRGISYVAALEAALKLKETALVHAEGFAGGELKHGVIALIEKGIPCFVMAPNDKTYPEIISNAAEIKARGGFIIGIGPKKASVFDEFLPTADLSEATLISQVVSMQLLAYYLALERGIKDPDKPRNLAKSVTVK